MIKIKQIGLHGIALVTASLMSCGGSSVSQPAAMASKNLGETKNPTPGAEGEMGESPATVGMAAPVTDSLVDGAGGTVLLASQWQKGPAVLFFYMGHW